MTSSAYYSGYLPPGATGVSYSALGATDNATRSYPPVGAGPGTSGFSTATGPSGAATGPRTGAYPGYAAYPTTSGAYPPANGAAYPPTSTTCTYPTASGCVYPPTASAAMSGGPMSGDASQPPMSGAAYYYNQYYYNPSTGATAGYPTKLSDGTVPRMYGYMYGYPGYPTYPSTTYPTAYPVATNPGANPVSANTTGANTVANTIEANGTRNRTTGNTGSTANTGGENATGPAPYPTAMPSPNELYVEPKKNGSNTTGSNADGRNTSPNISTGGMLASGGTKSTAASDNRGAGSNIGSPIDPLNDKTVKISSMLTPGFYDASNNWIPKYIGYLKSYNSSQGYGFISCAETHVIHKQDVFIHRAQVEENNRDTAQPQVGQWVEFVVKSNERGQPQARNVVWLEGKIDPAKMEHSKSATETRTEPTATSPKAEKESEEIFTGTLKSFIQASGYGFIDCPAMYEKYNRDVYVHKSEMASEPQKGATCEFQYILNAKGQPQAKHCRWNV